MTLNVNQPTDQCLVSELPAYIRANRVAINAVIAEESDITTTELLVSAGATSLVVGVNLTAIGIEVVLISGLGVSVIEQIRGGTEGQIKVFIFQTNVVSFADGAKNNGQLYLNQLPVLSNFNAQQDDVICLVNVGGDGGANYGYWKEIWRQISVK